MEYRLGIMKGMNTYQFEGWNKLTYLKRGVMYKRAIS